MLKMRKVAPHEMKHLFRIFELSKNEQRVALIIVLILITIGFVAFERRTAHPHGDSASSAQPKPAPTVATVIDQ